LRELDAAARTELPELCCLRVAFGDRADLTRSRPHLPDRSSRVRARHELTQSPVLNGLIHIRNLPEVMPVT
jgi:hypothetical protein